MAKNKYPAKYMLPTNAADLVTATNMLEEAARKFRRPCRVGWRYDMWWLRGIRKFRIMWSAGEVNVNYQNDRAELQMRFEDVLIKRQREQGRLRQMDIRPSVSSRGVGLDALRKSSVAQVVLDNLTSNLQLEQVKGVIADLLLDYGMCAACTWVEESCHLGQMPVIEIVPPWELLPIPADPSIETERKGICRDRWVPESWVLDKEGLSFPREDRDMKLCVRMLGPGERLPGDSDPTGNSSSTSGGSVFSPYTSANVNNDKLYTRWVYLREFWIEGEPNRVARYIVKVGNHIALDRSFPGAEDKECPIMPVQVISHHPGTGFYSRSFVSPLIPINRKQERMAANLFQNVEDLDLYGLRLIPLSWISKDQLKNLGRLRYAFYKPDIASQGRIKIEQLLPQNLGDMPGKIVEMASAMIDRLSRESDIWSGKAEGRVDSASGHGLLYETSGIPMIPVTASIGDAMANIYGAMLQVAGTLLKDKQGSSIKLLTLDDAIAGVVLDPLTGEMTLDDKNIIPAPNDVNIDIRERRPRLETKTIQDLEFQYESGKLDLVDYITECMRRNIDVPCGNRGIKENIRTQWMENLVLFGDGDLPGEILMNTNYDNHKVHLRILEDFIARPEWRLASVSVRTKFLVHKQWHEMQLGEWPNGVPNPEALGEMQPQLQQGLIAGAQGQQTA